MAGLIVSIQGYTAQTTQELIDIALRSGAVGVRTDQPSYCDGVHIGLKKNDKKYYITTDIEDIIRVSQWAQTIAIDSRRGNPDIERLYRYCDLNLYGIVADIENEEDLKNLKTLHDNKKIKSPEYIATTFSNQKTGEPDIEMLKVVKEYFPDCKVIAEGGYFERYKDVKDIVDYICIGAGITDIGKKIENIYKELL